MVPHLSRKKLQALKEAEDEKKRLAETAENNGGGLTGAVNQEVNNDAERVVEEGENEEGGGDEGNGEQ